MRNASHMLKICNYCKNYFDKIYKNFKAFWQGIFFYLLISKLKCLSSSKYCAVFVLIIFVLQQFAILTSINTNTSAISMVIICRIIIIYYNHCVKSVRIRKYSGPYFPAFGLNTENIWAKTSEKLIFFTSWYVHVHKKC